MVKPTGTLKRGARPGEYIGRDGVVIRRTAREVTDDYGHAGEVEWRIETPDGEPFDIVPTLTHARNRYGFR